MVQNIKLMAFIENTFSSCEVVLCVVLDARYNVGYLKSLITCFFLSVQKDQVSYPECNYGAEVR